MADTGIATRVLINNQVAYCTPEDLADGQPTILDGLNFTWGRETIVDQPDPGSASFTVRQQILEGSTGPATLFTALHAGAVVQIRSTAAGRDVLCWVGEITTVTVTAITDHAISADVTCIDASATLSNVTIGDQPWPQQDSYSRFQAILTAAGLKIHSIRPTPPTGFDYALTGEMDPSLQDRTIVYRDVDAQPPLDLFHSLATSVGGICWLTADAGGPYLWFEDAGQRDALKKFWINPADHIVYIRDIAFDDPDSPDLWSANDVIRDPVTWTQDPSQAITSVNVTWQQPGVDEDGQPTSTELVETSTDSTSVDKYGIRVLDISTELADRLQAHDLAFTWMANSRTAEWLLTGVTIDTAILTRPTPDRPPTWETQRLNKTMDMLDIRQRIGHRLSVEDLPEWAPTGTQQSYYLDGGTYTWENHRWNLELTASSNAIGGGAIYEEFPPDQVTWEDIDPTLTWWDIYGVAAPDPLPAGATVNQPDFVGAVA